MHLTNQSVVIAIQTQRTPELAVSSALENIIILAIPTETERICSISKVKTSFTKNHILFLYVFYGLQKFIKRYH